MGRDQLDISRSADCERVAPPRVIYVCMASAVASEDVYRLIHINRIYS